MTIAEEAITSSEVIVLMVEDEDGEVYEDSYETTAANLAGSGASYTLEVADGELSMSCTLSGSSLDCSGTLDDTVTLQATLTK